MTYSERDEYEDDFNSEELTKEELLTAYNRVLTKREKSCLSSDNLKKTTHTLQKESNECTATIKVLEKQVSYLNSNLGNFIILERKFKKACLPDEKLECGEMTKDMKRTN